MCNALISLMACFFLLGSHCHGFGWKVATYAR